MSYDNWKLDYPSHYDDEPEADYCGVCDTEYHKDDGEMCECFCRECGEEFPEGEDDGHCPTCADDECCECEKCLD